MIPTITLTPTGGDTLTITDPYKVIGVADWGDSAIEAQLAEGPDIIGAIAGTRRELTREVTLPLFIQADSGEDYLTAAHALDVAATGLGRVGGTLTYQVRFSDGTDSEELSLEILSCAIHADPEWQDRAHGMVTLTMTAQPGWLAVEEQLATDATFTDSVKRLAVTTRGNLPGPGRIVLADNDGAARRFLELGGAFTQAPQQVEYLSGAFTEEAGTDGADAGAIGGNSLELSPVYPVWTTVGILENLPHSGSYRVRIRTRGGEDDAQFISRVQVRSGANGNWTDLGGRVQTPDADNYYDLDAGALRKYDSAETISLRVDVRSTANTSESYYLNSLTITPAELYTVARGLPVEVISTGVSAYDDFSDMDSGDVLDDGATPRVAPSGETWDEAGDSSPEFTANSEGNLIRRSANDGTGSVGSGQYVLLDSGSPYTDLTVGITGAVKHDGPVVTESWTGALARYVDTSNWLIACMRVRHTNDGSYVAYVALYKRTTADGVVRLEQFKVKGTGSNVRALSGNVAVAVDASGRYRLFASVDPGTSYLTAYGGSETSREGTHADLAGPSGTLKSGKIGAYSLVQSDRNPAYSELARIYGFASATTQTYGNVIRENGIGVLNSHDSYAADADGSDPQPFTPQGNRIWLPPGTGEITAKVRQSDADAEPDVGAGNDTAITVYQRPAFANLSDALGDAPLDDLVIV